MINQSNKNTVGYRTPHKIVSGTIILFLSLAGLANVSGKKNLSLLFFATSFVLTFILILEYKTPFSNWGRRQVAFFTPEIFLLFSLLEKQGFISTFPSIASELDSKWLLIFCMACTFRLIVTMLYFVQWNRDKKK